MHLSCGAGEDSWESLGLQGDQSVHSKRNQSWIFIGRTEAEAEAPILWPPDAKNWLIWKDPDAGKDWRQEKGMTEDEMFGWRHWLDGHEFEQALGVGDRQGSLACSSPWGHKESDTTEWLNWTESNLKTALPWKGEMGSEGHGRGWRTIVVVQSLSCIPLFEIPWTAALQASLSLTISLRLPKLMSIELVTPSSHLILCRPLLLLPSILPSSRVFSNESALCIKTVMHGNSVPLVYHGL